MLDEDDIIPVLAVNDFVNKFHGQQNAESSTAGSQFLMGSHVREDLAEGVV